MVSFEEQVYEIAFGDDAINKGYTEEDVLSRLRTFSDVSFNHQDLKLSDFERGYLLHFSLISFEDFVKQHDDDMWYGITLNARVFDLNIWRSSEDGTVYCSVYECIKGLEQPDNYTTDADRWFQLWERRDA